MNKKGFSLVDVSITILVICILVLPITKLIYNSTVLRKETEKNNKVTNQIEEIIEETKLLEGSEILNGVKISKEHTYGKIKGKLESSKKDDSYYKNSTLNTEIEIFKGGKSFKKYKLKKLYIGDKNDI